MTHLLKTWPEYYDQVAKGNKKFELRKDDRPFKVGDNIVLQEYIMDGDNSRYTGAVLYRRIRYILRDAEGFGLKKGYCILGLDHI